MKIEFGMKTGLLVLTLFTASALQADIVPTFVSVAASTTNPGDFTWVYTATLTTDSRLDTTSPWTEMFTIFDFAGLIAGSESSSNPDFLASSALVGPNAFNTTPPDNPAIPNITWTWTGSTNVPPGTNLGVFTADSIFNLSTLAAFDGQSTKDAAGNKEDGTELGNVGSTDVPTGTVPEPSTMLLLAGGLFGVGLLRRHKTSR